MHMTVVVDDYCGSSDLRGEHGYCVFIETPRGNLLFDTGGGSCTLFNLRALGIDLRKIDGVVLSHGHYDHAGGLPELLFSGLHAPVWGHRAVWAPHAARHKGQMLFAGAHLHPQGMDFHPVDGEEEILPGVLAFTMPKEARQAAYVPLMPDLLLPDGNGGWMPDPLEDDLSLLVRGRFGWSVLLGCAHAGTANILERAASLAGTRDFYVVAGGMHFCGQDEAFLARTLEAVETRFSVKKWRPGHCTGFCAAAAFAARFPDVGWNASGTKLEL